MAPPVCTQGGRLVWCIVCVFVWWWFLHKCGGDGGGGGVFVLWLYMLWCLNGTLEALGYRVSDIKNQRNKDMLHRSTAPPSESIPISTEWMALYKRVSILRQACLLEALDWDVFHDPRGIGSVCLPSVAPLNYLD